jgi:hypothetical protein
MVKVDRENHGVLFKNKNKEKDTHSDYDGVINVEGKEFWLNAWINTSKSGMKYMAVTVRPRLAKGEKPALKVVGGTDTPDPDDEIPF